ncbi:MAG: acetyl-CoA carboxylase carboxyl transferase subunit alpha [Blautia sp.]|nr:acetyl-CoA carboxylase carboxyl transferase subunit alpha [Blautia sp.]
MTEQKRDPWKIVELSRDKRRLTSRDYIENVFSSFFELHGDRLYGDDPAILCGPAWLDDYPVMLLTQNRGRTPEEAEKCRYGMPAPEGYRKALRLMAQAEKFHIPLINLIDTPGAFSGIEAEYRGQGSAIAHSLRYMIRLGTPVISIVIGQGGSGGALALAVADHVYMLRNATYSILSPEGFANILYKDVSKKEEAARQMQITSEELLQLGVVEGIIDEDDNGNWNDPERTYRSMKETLLEDLGVLTGKTTEELLENRRKRFRSF